jgi:hypothetical protein
MGTRTVIVAIRSGHGAPKRRRAEALKGELPYGG